MNIILVNPPSGGMVAGLQSGLVIMKNYLQKRGLQVIITDLSNVANSDVTAFTRSIQKQDLIGITVATATYQSGLAVARSCKKAQSDCRIILGGPHIMSESPEIILNHNPEVDFLCLND